MGGEGVGGEEDRGVVVEVAVLEDQDGVYGDSRLAWYLEVAFVL